MKAYRCLPVQNNMLANRPSGAAYLYDARSWPFPDKRMNGVMTALGKRTDLRMLTANYQR